MPFNCESTPESIVLSIFGAEIGEEGKKKVLREALRLWHPDKFLPKFQHRIQESERGEIVKIVNHVSTVLLNYRIDPK